MSQLLEYVYAGIYEDSGLCHSCITTTYIIDHPAWVQVPALSEDYYGKYYHDGHWYADADFTVACPELDW